jgi:hypothetical protein
MRSRSQGSRLGDKAEKLERESSKGTKGKAQIICNSRVTVTDSESGEVYEIDVEFEDTLSGHRKPVAVPVKRVWSGGWSEKVKWTNDILVEYLLPQLRRWNALYESEHTYIYRPRRVVPGDSEAYRGDMSRRDRLQVALDNVLAGPDSPGRRFALAHRKAKEAAEAMAYGAVLAAVPESRDPGQEG